MKPESPTRLADRYERSVAEHLHAEHRPDAQIQASIQGFHDAARILINARTLMEMEQLDDTKLEMPALTPAVIEAGMKLRQSA